MPTSVFNCEMSSNPNAPLCQFFLRGQCRFGQKCRNRHQQNSSSNSGTASKTTVTTTSDQIRSDLSLGGCWPFSVYGPEKDFYPPVNLITGIDWSFEEARMDFYQAQLMHQVAAFIQQRWQPQLQQAQLKRQQLLNHADQAVQMLINQKQQQPPPTVTSAFGASSQMSGGSVFGGSGGGGGGTQAPMGFGRPQAPTTSAFQQQPSSVFTSQPASVFASQPAPSSVFASTTHPTPPAVSAFAPPPGSTGFPQVQPTPTGHAVFGQPPTQPQPFQQAPPPSFGTPQPPSQSPFQLQQQQLQQQPPGVAVPAFGHPGGFPPATTTTSAWPTQAPASSPFQPSSFQQQQQPVQQLAPLQTLPPELQQKWGAAEFQFGQIPEEEPPDMVCR